MSDFGDGLGSAIEGSLFARALEPDSGAKPVHPHQPEACLNCGAQLVGAYCHACGQEAHVHRTIGGFLHDLMHGALHFEGKLWRTLPLLVFTPGKLTRRYIDGARARFVSPMALFLFSVFLMFAVFQALGISAPTDIGGGVDVAGGIEAARDMTEAEVEDAQADLAELSEDDPDRTAAEQRLAEARSGLQKIEDVAAMTLDDMSEPYFNISGTGIDWVDKGLIEKWRKHPELMLYKLQANSYKFSWLLIPLSLPFVWLVFAWKRQFKAYDHAIFVTYSLSFMSLMFVTLSVVGKLGISAGWLFALGIIIAPIHIYKQLRKTYQLSRFSTIWRLVILVFFITVIIGLFLQVLLILGAF